MLSINIPRGLLKKMGYGLFFWGVGVKDIKVIISK
jgi:hypothetical protein